MLSVQNIHLGQAENTTELVHAARSGRRPTGRRAASRRGGLSNAGRWALGAGAATAGIAIMGRTKLGRKITRKVVRSKAMGGIRRAAVTGLRRVRGTKVGVGARKGINAARRYGARGVNSAKQAAGRVYGSSRAAPVRGAVAGLRRRVASLQSRLRSKVRVSSKTSITKRR